MDDSLLAPLEARIAEGVAGIVPAVIEQVSEIQLMFYLLTPVGYLQFDVQLNEEDEDTSAVEIIVWPLFTENDEFCPYDLCALDVSGYETLDTLQRSLVWGRLELWGAEQRSKQPVLTRIELLEYDASIDSYQFQPVLSIIEMLFAEALQVTPILAKLSIGENVEASNLEFALSDVSEAVQ